MLMVLFVELRLPDDEDEGLGFVTARMNDHGNIVVVLVLVAFLQDFQQEAFSQLTLARRVVRDLLLVEHRQQFDAVD